MSSERMSLAVRNGAWSIGGYAATQIFRTVTTLVLAKRYLGPETFGVVGLVTVFLSGLMMFSELGILAAVVQHKRGDDFDFLDTAFSIQAFRGIAIWLVSVAAAYPMAHFYNQPELLPLLLVAGLSEVVRGLSSTAALTLNRHLRLKKVTLLAIAAEGTALVVSVVWAMVAPSAWVLVGRMIVAAAVSAAGSHFLVPHRARFRWDGPAARDLLHFGGWISISTAAHFLGSQGERLILGKVITPAELGCFSMALMISSVPALGIGQLVNQIFLPMISATVRNSREDTIRDFSGMRRLFGGLSLVTAAGFLLCAKPLVAVALNPKYAMTGWMLEALGLRVALDLFAAPASQIILAYGKSQYAAAANTTRMIFVVGGICAAFHWFGIREAVFALVVAQAVSYFPLIVGLGKLLPEVTSRELRWYTVLLLFLAAGATASWFAISA
jgi:O-antigen/teichoic acid export membrane protein